MNNIFLYLQIIAYAVVIVTVLFVFVLLLIKEIKRKQSKRIELISNELMDNFKFQEFIREKIQHEIDYYLEIKKIKK